MWPFKRRSIKKILANAKKYGIMAPDEFWETPEEELDKIYNGAGPDALPKWGRVILTFFLRIFECAFVVHDFRFHNSDGKKEGFIGANEEMWINMCIIIYYLFDAWWAVAFKTFWSGRAWIAYKACCSEKGWYSWQQAHDRRKQCEQS